MRAARSPHAALLLAAIAIGASACGSNAPHELEVRARLLDTVVALPDARLEAHAHVTVDGIARPVVSAAREMRLLVACDTAAAGAGETCRVQPSEAVSAPWAIVDSRLMAAHTRQTCAGFEPGAPPCEIAVLRGTTPNVTARLVPPLAQRDVLTRPLAIPSGATLRFAVGVEEEAWTVDAAPVVFTVTASEGARRRELFRRRLDPTRVPEDRHWFEETVDLGPLAGTTVTLQLAAAPETPGDGRPSLPLWAEPVVLAPGARHVPSVVLVSLDTLRARSVGAYGHTIDTMPYLGRLAGEGALFEHASTAYPNTFGSHMTMLTGLLPATHTVRHKVFDRLPDDKPTLAATLHAAGYATAAFTEDAWLYAPAGFRRGFEHYFEDTKVAIGGGDAAETFGRAAAWVEVHHDRPVFVFAHTYTVHSPYDPPEQYRGLFVRPGVDAKVLAYEQEARQLDDELRRFVERLERTLGRDFLLVVTADHGEEFFEHGAFAHLELYDEVMQVPLIVRWPGTVPAGRRVGAVVSLADVTPTIVDLLGLGAHPGDGLSLAALARGTADALDRTVVLGESPPGFVKGNQWFFVARSATAKCLLPGGTGAGECHDLVRDPGEHAPLDPDASPEIARVHREAAEYRARSTRTISHDRPAEAADMAPEVKDKLKALGYTE